MIATVAVIHGPAAAAASSPNVAWAIVPTLTAYEMTAIHRINDRSLAVGSTTAAGAGLVYDPATKAASLVLIDGVAQNIGDLNERDEIVGAPGLSAQKAYYENLDTGVVKIFDTGTGVPIRPVALNDQSTVIGTLGWPSGAVSSWLWHPGTSM